MTKLQSIVSNWYKQAQQCPMFRLSQSGNTYDYQLKIDKRTGDIVIVLVEFSARLRGRGYFSRMVQQLQTIAPVAVECPQPRLREWCKRNNIRVIY